MWPSFPDDTALYLSRIKRRPENCPVLQLQCILPGYRGWYATEYMLQKPQLVIMILAVTGQSQKLLFCNGVVNLVTVELWESVHWLAKPEVPGQTVHIFSSRSVRFAAAIPQPGLFLSPNTFPIQYGSEQLSHYLGCFCFPKFSPFSAVRSSDATIWVFFPFFFNPDNIHDSSVL